MKKRVILLLAILIIAASFFLFIDRFKGSSNFDGANAYAHVMNQVALGPRTPGSQAHADVIDYISGELTKCGWGVEIQNDTFEGHRLKNIIARRSETKKYILLGAHYDSRLVADKDPDHSKRDQPVPGANDGASGVAVLLELACSLPENLPNEVMLVFFDLEDQGKITGWDWILGSRAFVNDLQSIPEAVVILDMIGDKDLNIHMESNSDPEINAQIWSTAKNLGYSENFITGAMVGILDDHTPFIEKGIHAVDIIDIKYVYWHTTEDTIDKVSPESLEIIGRTIQAWLLNYEP